MFRPSRRLIFVERLSQLQQVILLLLELGGHLEREVDDRVRQTGQPGGVEPVRFRARARANGVQEDDGFAAIIGVVLVGKMCFELAKLYLGWT
jgi:hypothetical protein